MNRDEQGDVVRALADEVMAELFRADPLMPSLYGLPGEHDRLPDLGLAARDRRLDRLRELLTAARAVPDAGLPEQDLITRDVLIEQVRSTVDMLDARLVEFAVSDGLDAPALSLLLMLPMIPLTDREKAEGFLARLAAVPSFMDTVLERQRLGAAAGLIPPDFLVRIGIDYVERYLAAPETDPLLIEPEVPFPGFAEERDRLLAEVVRPAYRRYLDFLVTELAPLARPAERPGLCWLPEGRRRYTDLIRLHTTTERSAQELHDTGLELIGALAREYRALGAEVFGTDDLAGVFHRLRTDPELRWRDGAEMLELARDTIDRAWAAAPHWFGTIPPQQCEVRSMPEADAVSGTIAYYLQPALDGSRQGIYFANTVGAAERPRYTGEAIAFHETVPGHHFQICIGQELTELPLLRRLAEFTAYIEGWGLYTERLADEMGLYSSPLARFGMLVQDSMRAGRLVVDTGLHALGWSRQRAVDFLRENTPMAEREIEAEIDRYTATPGQALAYMVGRLEIQRIRAAAELSLGDRFDLREFHDVLLGNGVLPLTVLDSVVTAWVRDRSAAS